MEFSTRLCKPGDEQALSLVGQATILETYAGLSDGDDLIKYAAAEMTTDLKPVRLYFRPLRCP
jgi:hypothetical protein